MARTWGYLRVSRMEQDLEKNKLDILMLANTEHLGQVEFVEEKVSGTVSWRKRKIGPLIAQGQAGDSIVGSRAIPPWTLDAGMYRDPGHCDREGYPYLRRQGKLEARWQYTG